MWEEGRDKSDRRWVLPDADHKKTFTYSRYDPGNRPC